MVPPSRRAPVGDWLYLGWPRPPRHQPFLHGAPGKERGGRPGREVFRGKVRERNLGENPEPRLTLPSPLSRVPPISSPTPARSLRRIRKVTTLGWKGLVQSDPQTSEKQGAPKEMGRKNKNKEKERNGAACGKVAERLSRQCSERRGASPERISPTPSRTRSRVSSSGGLTPAGRD